MTPPEYTSTSVAELWLWLTREDIGFKTLKRYAAYLLSSLRLVLLDY